MNINTNINGENVTIKNVLGDVNNSSIVYIDSSDNLVVKTEPIENRSKIIGTGAEDLDSDSGVLYSTVGAYKTNGNAKNSSCLNVSNAVYSIVEQHQALSNYFAYRVKLVNHNPDLAYTVGLCKSAPSPTSGNNGTSLSYTTLTFGGETSAILSAATTVSTTDTDVDDIAPYVLTSDVVYVSNLPRTDVSSALPLQYVRTLFTSAISAPGTTSGTYLPTATNRYFREYTGLEFYADGSSYDFVTGNSPRSPSSAFSYMIAHVEFIYDKPTLKVLTIGDSTNTGIGTSAGNFAFIDSAAKVSRDNNSSVLVCPYKYASSGRRLIGTYNIFNQLVKTGKLSPNIVIIPSWSINDGTDTSAFDKSFALVSEMLETCKEKNIVSWVLTPPCKNGFSESELSRWTTYRNKILALSPKVNIFDIANIMGDVTTGTWFSGYTTDGTHPNNISTPVIGLAMYNDILKKYL